MGTQKRVRRTKSIDKEDKNLLRSRSSLYFGASALGPVRSAPFLEPDRVDHQTRLKMRKDPVIALGLWTIKAPLCVSRFTIKCDDPIVRAFVTQEMEKIWCRLVRTTLLMLDFGWQPHEKVYEVRDTLIRVAPSPEKSASSPSPNPDGVDSQPDEMPKRPRPRDVMLEKAIGVKLIKDINPDTVTPIYDPGSDEFIGIEQYAGHNVEGRNKIFIEKPYLYLPTFQSEWGNMEGHSLLDSAYRPWYYAHLVEQLWARFMERRTVPPLLGTMPPGKRIDPDTGEEFSTEDAILTVMQNLHHGNASALPYEPDATTKQNSWSIEALQFFSQSDQFQTFIATMDGRMLRGLLIPEKAIIQGTKVGTLSETESFADTFMTGLDTMILQIQGLAQEIVDDLVRLNFSPRPTCTLQVSQITSQRRTNMTDLVTLLSEASDVNSKGVEYKFADLIDLVSIGESLGLPLRDPDDILRRNASDEQSTPGEAKDQQGEAPAGADGPGDKPSGSGKKPS